MLWKLTSKENNMPAQSPELNTQTGRSPDPVNQTVLNVPMPNACKTMLQQISDDTNLSMSQLVRDMIGVRHRMQFSNRPACAIGTLCHCPQMHPVRLPEQETDQQRIDRQQAITSDRVNPEG